jgi:hypothetical protein
MPDLVVIVPSRERPWAAREMADAFAQTCTADTELMFALDDDDPTGIEYGIEAGWVSSPSRSMVEALNYAATILANGYSAPPFAIGVMGDDHRPRARGWDEQYLAALRDLRTGIVYGDDLLQGEHLPTQCAMTADIVRALGYMAPPSLTHLYVDNAWASIGQSAGCLRYLPDVVVEHVHPFAGKAAMDAGYVRVNDQGMYHRDRVAFEAYVAAGDLAADVAKVRALRGAHV